MHQATVVKLPFGISTRYLTAGSFKNFPVGQGYYGIKLAPEIPQAQKPADLVVQIPDFGLPTPQDMYSAIRVALYQTALGRKVYVGCMGGYGRTGTFLALLMRILGVPEPIAHVRAVYCNHAVETRKQEEFVRTLFTGPLRYDVLRARYTAAIVDRHVNGHSVAAAILPKTEAKAICLDYDAGPEPRWLT